MAILSQIVKFKNNLLARVNAERLMLVLSLAAVLIVNFQLLFRFFYGDDFLHFYQISNWSPLAFIFYPFGGHLFIFRNLIFYCMFKLFGLNSVVYFSTVLLTHLGSAYILYKIIHLLTDKPSLAAVGMMIWGICPVNYATLAWYSAYGQILVGFFFLLFLYDLLRIEKGKILFSMKIVIRWSIYFLLMAASFGTGLAIACLSPVAIVIILWKNDQKWKIAAMMFPAIAVILLLFIFKDSIYYYFSGEVYNSKPVALCVALSNYKIILEMFIRMCTYSIYCMAAFPMLFLSSTIKYPTAAFLVSFPFIALFIVLFFRSKEYKRHYAVLSIFFLGLIGLTAYERAPGFNFFHIPISFISSQFWYYYVIFIIVVIILALMADELLDIFPKIAKVIVAIVLIVIAISIYPSINLAPKIDLFNTSVKEKKIYYNTIIDIEKTIGAYSEGSTVFIDNKMNDKISLFYPSDTDFPGKAAIFSIKYPNNTVEGRRVYFIENDCRVADKNIEKKKWRISSLIVSACELNKQSN
ncbi:MAG: hypothetical protein ABSC54_00925 [Smithellaceae bacterium]|jgi:hypothetical protein